MLLHKKSFVARVETNEARIQSHERSETPGVCGTKLSLVVCIRELRPNCGECYEWMKPQVFFDFNQFFVMCMCEISPKDGIADTSDWCLWTIVSRSCHANPNNKCKQIQQ